jgi:hypothetical protein
MRNLTMLGLGFLAVPAFLVGCASEVEELVEDETVATTAEAITIPDSCKNRDLACTRAGLTGTIGGLNTWALENVAANQSSLLCGASLLLSMNDLPATVLECIHYEGGEPHLSSVDCVSAVGITIACAVAPCFPATAPIAPFCAAGKFAAAAYECIALTPICEQDKQNQLPIDQTQCPIGSRTTVQACVANGNGGLTPRSGGEIDTDCRAAVTNLGMSPTGSNSAQWYNCERYCFANTIASAATCNPNPLPPPPPPPAPVCANVAPVDPPAGADPDGCFRCDPPPAGGPADWQWHAPCSQ